MAARAELAPEGALQAELVTRIVAAAWRARRADRLEAALFGRLSAEQPGDPQATLGHGLMRDNYGPRALETLVRYRGTVLAELFRALGALKALQAELRAPSADAAAVGRTDDHPPQPHGLRAPIIPASETNPRSEPRTTA